MRRHELFALWHTYWTFFGIVLATSPVSIVWITFPRRYRIGSISEATLFPSEQRRGIAEILDPLSSSWSLPFRYRITEPAFRPHVSVSLALQTCKFFFSLRKKGSRFLCWKYGNPNLCVQCAKACVHIMPSSNVLRYASRSVGLADM